MKPREEFLDGKIILYCGDCVSIIETLSENSIDAVVCDPPYGLEFMGKEWDGSDGFRRSLNEADIGRDNAFGRTSARAPEYRTAGTGQKGKPGIGERKTEWVSNQGWNQFRCGDCGRLFHGGSPCQCVEPKPIRDNRWNLFQSWCEAWATECLRVLKPGGHLIAFGGSRTYHRLACAVEDAGFEIRDQIQWLYGSGFPKSRNIGNGRGTALKPAHEPIVLARKPLIGTVAENVLAHGVGALNIDGCRIETAPGDKGDWPITNRRHADVTWTIQPIPTDQTTGRWPANVVHDGSPEVVESFPVVGESHAPNNVGTVRSNNVFGADSRPRDFHAGFSDSGSAARFFYSSKADTDDRLGSKHPTVKPVDLMQWLVRLVTPPKGTVLDPFAGTGTTGEAAYREGFNAVLIEREEEYQKDIRRRMGLILAGPVERKRESLKAAGRVEDAGPLFSDSRSE